MSDSAAMPTFYRIVRTNPPTLADFCSDRVAGRRQPPPALRHLWEGFSAFDTEEGARRMAQRFPAIGAFVAAFEVPDEPGFRAERTLSTPGHYTV